MTIGMRLKVGRIVAASWFVCAATCANAAVPDAAANGSLSLVITYQTAPANRPELRRELERSTAPLLRRWQDAGRVKGYRLLFNRFADSDNWDAMAVLTFADPEAMAQWKAVERSTPAGLSAKALARTTAVHTAPVDLVRADSSPAATDPTVFVVIPYKTLVSTGEYLTYADGYVIPQFKGWMDDGVLSRYALYVGSFPAGRPWSAMVILEYKDDAALSARNAVVAKVRERLKNNAEWKAISDNKKSVRDEEQVVIADPVAAH